MILYLYLLIFCHTEGFVDLLNIQKEITKLRRRRTDAAALQTQLCVTFGLGQETLAVAPLQLEDVEAGEILQVHQNNHQRVQLICQPEVCKLHPVERRREDAELEVSRGRRSEAFVCQKLSGAFQERLRLTLEISKVSLSHQTR